MSAKLVLFICIENACRSLMAESMFNSDPPDGWRAVSAGTRPAAAANPRTSSMLSELGLPLPAHSPQMLTPEMAEEATVRVTMGCLDDASCPAHLKTLALRDWGLADPAAMDDAGFRSIRDTLQDRIRGLRTELILSNRQATDRERSAR